MQDAFFISERAGNINIPGSNIIYTSLKIPKLEEKKLLAIDMVFCESPEEFR